MNKLIAILVLALIPALMLCPAAMAGGRWVSANGGNIPDGAVQGGSVPSADLYVCRAEHQGGTHVGKLFHGRCYIGWGGREVAVDRFQVLVDDSGVAWREHYGGFPSGAVIGGHAPVGDLYVCRARYRDGTHIGKVVNRQCLIGWGGKEIGVTPYEVLVARGANWRHSSGYAIPPGAVGGGATSAGELYVCRGHYRDGVHPGKLFKGRCHIGWGGQEAALDNYEVLVRPGGMHWAPAGQAYGNCVAGGQANGQRQCVCRGHYRDGMHVGKTHQGRCNIGWGGQEVILDNFEVLVNR